MNQKSPEAASSSPVGPPIPSASSPPADPSPTDPLVAEYLAFKIVEQGRSPATIESYGNDLNAYCEYLSQSGQNLIQVTPSMISQYVTDQQELGRAEASVIRSLVAIRGLHNFLVAEEIRLDDPAREVEIPTQPLSLPKALTLEEAQALLESADGPKPADIRDRAILEVLYGTGLRVSELCGLSIGDFDEQRQTLRVFGKGSRERIVPLGRLALKSLQDWLAPEARGAMEPKQWRSADDAESIFLNRSGQRISRQGVWGVVKKYGKAAGVGAKLSPHFLRHSFATHMMDNGADVRTLQEFLGHASVSTTQIYTKVSLRRLREVYETAHPRARVD